MSERAGVIITDGERFLIGHAPNKKNEPNTWDLPKGHVEKGETPYEAAKREAKEEFNVNVEGMELAGKYKLGKDDFWIYVSLVNNLPVVANCKCNSYFDWYGKKLPEISEFRLAKLDDIEGLLYKSLVSPVLKALGDFLD